MSEPILTVTDLTKRFGALTATDRVTLDLKPGEIHALIGPNGAGKSTLIKLITGEMRPDAGSIRFEGETIDGVDAAGRARRGLARSFQVSSVVPGFTALENVALAVQGASRQSYRFHRPALLDPHLTEPARFHLEQAGLSERAPVTAAELSHGERRKLEIAMALALRPRAFLLDEPMAGMGADGTRALTALLADLKAEAPILLVEHDMDAVFALADRVSVLVYGRIIASGSVAAIRADPEVRRSYLGENA